MGKFLHAFGTTDLLIEKIDTLMDKKYHAKHIKAPLYIIYMVSIYTVLFGTNNIAILLTGKFSKKLSIKYNISPEKSACILDTVSCALYAMVPYSPLLLLASKLSGCTPFDLAMHSYFSFVLLTITILYVLCGAENTNLFYKQNANATKCSLD